MSNIGMIYRHPTKPGEDLHGYINTLLITLAFRLERLPKSENPNAPAFRIVTVNDSGVDIPVGAAWVKTMQKAGREGEEFMTLSLDDPSFDKPLNIAAFKNKETGKWNITHRRPRKIGTR